MTNSCERPPASTASNPVSQTISDYKAFKAAIVDVDFAEFQRKSGDLRSAFHCAISLFHLSDWVYVAHQAMIDSSYTYQKNAQNHAVRKASDFANALADLHPDFELIRGVANSAKHLQLNPPPARTQPAHMPAAVRS